VEAVAALRSGQPVLLPTDGVYGLCSATTEDAVRGLYALKGRAATQPTALIAAGVEALLDLVPELRGRSETIARALLPGPWTLVLPNPSGRLPWLGGGRTHTIGVRVAVLPTETQRVLDVVGAVAATSANEPGEPAAAAVEDVSERIRDGCAAIVSAGRLSGEPSTVLDFTGVEPAILRHGAGDGEAALARVRVVLGDYDPGSVPGKE
jgi:L-threonylcarbamoyladenylate synthase